MMIKINGWVDRVAITQQQIQERWRNVSDKYSQRQAVKLYDEFILDVMKGKAIGKPKTTALNTQQESICSFWMPIV